MLRLNGLLVGQIAANLHFIAQPLIAARVAGIDLCIAAEFILQARLTGDGGVVGGEGAAAGRIAGEDRVTRNDRRNAIAAVGALFILHADTADGTQPADDAIVRLAERGDAVLLQPDAAGRRLPDDVGGRAGLAHDTGGATRAATVEGTQDVAVHVEDARDIVKVGIAVVGDAQFLRPALQVDRAVVLVPESVGRESRRSQEDGRGRGNAVDRLVHIQIIFLERADRRDRGAAKIPVGLQRIGLRLAVRIGFGVVVDLAILARCVDRPDDRLEHRVADLDQRGGAAIGVRLAIFAGQQQGQAVGGVPFQLAAHAPALRPVRPLVGGQVAGDALDVAVEAGNAGAQRVGDRTRNGAAGAIFIMLGNGDVALALKVARRARRRHADDAGRRILAEQGALRAAQHFDPLHIGEFGKALRRTHGDHAIDDDRNRRLNALAKQRGANAANTEAGVGGVGALLERERRHGLDQRVGVVDLTRCQRVRAHGGDGQRHVLQTLGALLRSDHDFARLILRHCLVLRHGRHGQHRHAHGQGGGRRN